MAGSVSERQDTGRAGEVCLDRLAHELRTPLAAIQSMADALGSGLFGQIENQRHASYVQSIADTARHALAVIETMLVDRGREAADAEDAPRVDIAALATDVVAGMAVLAARAGVRLVACDRARSTPQANARATDVRQMLINLVSNGIVHAGGGTEVHVATGEGDGVVWITVADDGAGISQTVLDQLELGLPIDGDDTSVERLRLGLALTRALAGANGGRLEIKATSPGTEARILLPAAR